MSKKNPVEEAVERIGQMICDEGLNVETFDELDELAQRVAVILGSTIDLRVQDQENLFTVWLRCQSADNGPGGDIQLGQGEEREIAIEAAISKIIVDYMRC